MKCTFQIINNYNIQSDDTISVFRIASNKFDKLIQIPTGNVNGPHKYIQPIKTALACITVDCELEQLIKALQDLAEECKNDNQT